MNHFKIICGQCGILLSECRCPSKHKEIRESLCQKCYHKDLQSKFSKDYLKEIEERCRYCGHLMLKHPRPKHLVGFGEWDYYVHSCCVKNCECNLSCFGQLLNEKGIVIRKYVKSSGGEQ